MRGLGYVKFLDISIAPVTGGLETQESVFIKGVRVYVSYLIACVFRFFLAYVYFCFILWRLYFCLFYFPVGVPGVRKVCATFTENSCLHIMFVTIGV